MYESFFEPDPEVDWKLAACAGATYLLYASPSIMGSIQDLKDKNWCAIMDEVVARSMLHESTC